MRCDSSRPVLVLLVLLVLVGGAAGCASTQRRPESVGSATVTSEELRNSNEPIEVLLQRKVPGLVISRTSDGSLALQIRGGSSFGGSGTPPLYVLNGLPFRPGPGGALIGVNPYDIESIKVLKEAEAGLYGIEGANGVIVITTKSGGRRRP